MLFFNKWENEWTLEISSEQDYRTYQTKTCKENFGLIGSRIKWSPSLVFLWMGLKFHKENSPFCHPHSSDMLEMNPHIKLNNYIK